MTKKKESAQTPRTQVPPVLNEGRASSGIPDDDNNDAPSPAAAQTKPSDPVLDGAARQARADVTAAADKTAAKSLKDEAVKKGIEPIKPKKSKADILKSISDESMRRVDIDAFLDARGADPYYVPQNLIPDGYTIEWKSTHIMGQPVDANYTMTIEQSGWQPVPVDLFPELVPQGYDKPYIERPGMVLMIRPASITAAIREADLNAALGQMQEKMKQLYATPANSMERVVTKNQRHIEGIAEKSPIPADQ